MKCPDAMRKPGVCCSWINELGEPKLLDPSEALEWPSLNNVPQRILKLVSLKLDEIM
jgi:hypothetical protein